jgi:DNA-binding transcriptional LysR family regulator
MRWEDQIGRRLRLKDLHTLHTVAELGSMAKASQRLALSQPAISKAIADMEHTVGAALLERSSRGVEVTDCGQLLLERARTIFDELRQGVADIAAVSDPTQGVIRIGTTEPLTVVVSEIIGHLSRKYPRIRYVVTISDGDTLDRDLRERKLDVLLRRWFPTVVADDLAVDVLFESPLGVLAGRHHPLLRRRHLQLVDLMDERWALSPPDSFLGRVVVDVFRRRNLPLPAAVVTTVSIYMRLTLLASGKFISVLPLTMLGHPSSRAWLRALDVDLADTTASTALITLKRRRASAPLKLFQQASLEVCKALAESQGSIG